MIRKFSGKVKQNQKGSVKVKEVNFYVLKTKLI